jgi:hypothetical protein
MLFSQRKVLYLFICMSLLLLSACIPTAPPERVAAAPEVNVSGTPASDGPEIVVDEIYSIPSECVVKGYQTFISLQWGFCFAYPPNSYVREATVPADDPNTLEVLLVYNEYDERSALADVETNPHTIIVPAELSPTGVEFTVTAPAPTLETASREAEGKPQQHISAQLLEINCNSASESKELRDVLHEETYRLPYVIGNESAQVIVKEKGGLVNHVLVVKHENVYCQLSFLYFLDFSFGYGSNGERVEADELLWPVFGSFSFLR